jgi:hypothetical protein
MDESPLEETSQVDLRINMHVIVAGVVLSCVCVGMYLQLDWRQAGVTAGFVDYNVSLESYRLDGKQYRDTTWSFDASSDAEITILFLDGSRDKLPAKLVNFNNLAYLEKVYNAPVSEQSSYPQHSYSKPRQLAELPPAIGELTKLTGLNLRGNHLSKLPPEFGKLKSLRYLNLANNIIYELPVEIENLTQMITLQLDHNQLSKLPAEIGKLTNLATLSLGGNHLPELPPEIRNLKKLKELNLDNNPITDADLELLKSLVNLKRLHLKNTMVTKEGLAALQIALPNCVIEIDI